MLTTVPIEELVERAETELGVSDYVTIDQETVDEFAEVTGDRQWIHCDPVRAAESPFGGTIAHGYLTLALGGYAMAVNYGLDKLRFPAVLPVGELVRMRVALDAADPIPGGCALRLTLTFERAAGGKPVCVADAIYRIYD
jgi:acyl dehydratase